MSLRWFADQITLRLAQGAMAGVAEGIGIVEDHTVQLIMGGKKSGRVYVRRGIAHQASAPGEAPASDTGTLVNSRVVNLIPERLAARLTWTAAHAPHLEHGTKKMASRPFARRGLFEKREEIEAAIQRSMALALR